MEDDFSDICDENRAVLIVSFFSFHDDGKKLEPSFQVEIVINFKNSVGERDFKEIKPTDLLKIVMRRFEKRDKNMFEHFLSFFVKSTVKQPYFLHHDGRTDHFAVLNVKFGFVG